MVTEKLKHTIKTLLFLFVISITSSHSIVREWEKDLRQGRPMSTWDWEGAIQEGIDRPQPVPETLVPYQADRDTYLALYKAYEASGFDYDPFFEGLQKATFHGTRSYSSFKTKKPPKIFPREASIIVPTHRPHDLFLTLENFHRQEGVKCELILIPNGKDYDIRATQTIIDEFIAKHPEHTGQIKIHTLDKWHSLGRALNIGIAQAKYAVVVRMDSDDLYGNHYVLNMFREGLDFRDARLYGKTCFPFVFADKRIRMPTDRLNQMIGPALQFGGATHVAAKEIFRSVSYSEKNQGEDKDLCHQVSKMGSNPFSTSCFDIAILRNPGGQSHTWQIAPAGHRQLKEIGTWDDVPSLLYQQDKA